MKRIVTLMNCFSQFHIVKLDVTDHSHKPQQICGMAIRAKLFFILKYPPSLKSGTFSFDSFNELEDFICIIDIILLYFHIRQSLS